MPSVPNHGAVNDVVLDTFFTFYYMLILLYVCLVSSSVPVSMGSVPLCFLLYMVFGIRPS